MKKNNSFGFCLAPWFHSFVHADGSIRPCCVSWDNIGDTQSGDTILSVWNNQKYQLIREQFLKSERLPGCKSCFTKEDSGASSRRQYLNKLTEKLTGLSLEHLRKSLVTKADPNLITLDISLGNLCNLRCRFCGPYNSTKWIKTAQELTDKNKLFWENIFGAKKYQPVQQNFESYRELIANSQHLQLIEFKGGEPFIMENHLHFLSELIDLGIARNIELVYVTNGTIIENDIINLFKLFKKISLTVSIDGTGDLYKYIRGENFSLEVDVLKNLKIFDELENISLNIHFTISAYNLFGIKDFITWFESLTFSNLKNWSWGMVAFPAEISVNSLPSEILEKAVEKLDNISGSQIESIKFLLLKKAKDNIKISTPQNFLTYVEDLDLVRGTCFTNIVLEYKDIFKN